MKKILCYLGILVLFGLAFLPPLLRTFLKDPGENKEPVKIENIILFCTSDSYVITTSYENDEVKKIAIKKIIANSETGDSEDLVTDDGNISPSDENPDNQIENNEDLLKNELDVVFHELKQNKDLIHNTLEDGEVIGIDFSTSSYDTLDIKNLTKTPEEQKTYYENLELTCVIRK